MVRKSRQRLWALLVVGLGIMSFVEDGDIKSGWKLLTSTISALFSAFFGFQKLIDLPFELRELFLGISGCIFMYGLVSWRSARIRSVGVAATRRSARVFSLALGLIAATAIIAFCSVWVPVGYQNVLVKEGPLGASCDRWRKYYAPSQRIALDLEFVGDQIGRNEIRDLTLSTGREFFYINEKNKTPYGETVEIPEFQRPQVLKVNYKISKCTEDIVVNPSKVVPAVAVLRPADQRRALLLSLVYGGMLWFVASVYLCWRWRSS